MASLLSRLSRLCAWAGRVSTGGLLRQEALAALRSGPDDQPELLSSADLIISRSMITGVFA